MLESTDIPISVVVAMLVATGGVTAWIEKRFRDSKLDLDRTSGSMTEQRNTALRNMNAEYVARFERITAMHEAAVARLDKDAALSNREVAQIRMEIYRDLSQYPTKQDLREMVGERFDRLEDRINDLVRTKG